MSSIGIPPVDFLFRMSQPVICLLMNVLLMNEYFISQHLALITYFYPNERFRNESRFYFEQPGSIVILRIKF